MVQFECPVLEGTATVKIIETESISEPGPDADPCRPPSPLAYIHIGRSTIDCKNKTECGLTNAATGITDWEHCPAQVDFRNKGTLEHLPGTRFIGFKR